uniref:Adenosine deaminase domain-containing protein 1-like n=1 Tax=Saccoglossus kowalevskii TaxID=10224 RepID=A0ABM0M6W1_SACKO|nr:PREDICTED: adenosine deaminase domain-containing protein 1-like [Saccoglossus kowalevskii]
MANSLTRDAFYQISQQQSTGTGSLRLPRSMPQVLQGQQMPSRLIAGIQQQEEPPVVSEAPATISYASAVGPGHSTAQITYNSLSAPPVTGTTLVPVTQLQMRAQEEMACPKKVPPELIQKFLSGAKNACAALNEFAQMRRIKLKYEESPVLDCSVIVPKFAFTCTTDGFIHKQGVGRTKKEAKTLAAKIALTTLLGVDEDVVESQKRGNVIYDSMGRVITLPDSDPHRYIPPEEKDPNKIQPTGKGGHFQLNAPLPTAYSQINKKFFPEKGLEDDKLKVIPGLHVAAAQTKQTHSAVSKSTQPPSGAYQPQPQKKQTHTAAAVSKVTQPPPGAYQPQPAYSQPVSSWKSVQPSVSHVPSPPLETHQKMMVGVKNLHKPLGIGRGHLLGQQYTLDDYSTELQPGGNGSGQVICLGTGCGSIDGRAIVNEGRSLVNCHGVAVARRSFQRFLYRELKLFYDGNLSESIFECISGSRLLSIKKSVSFHLYLNTAPCGDAARFISIDACSEPISDLELEFMMSGTHYPSINLGNQQGHLTVISNDGQMLSSLNKLQTWESITQSGVMYNMSCSDKLLMWNLLGLQGSLLSYFLEPIYLTSITLGNQYEHSHMARAMCCRLDDSISARLPGFKLHHPLLGRTSHAMPLSTANTDMDTTVSLNWSLGDSKYEVIDCKTGKCTNSSPFRAGASGASRLCKLAFYSRFLELCTKANRHDLLHASTYQQAKALCKFYQSSKSDFFHQLNKHGYGDWVVKPVEINFFSK